MKDPDTTRPRFWELPLSSLTRTEWEALCDGCGRCCLHKLQDADTDEVHYTRVVCRYMDQQQCRCTEYPQRQTLVPDCLVLTPDNLSELDWIPDTCAYKLRERGEPLPDWHPLMSGSREAMEEAGISVTGKVISETHVHDEGIEEHIIRWVQPAC
ncbi:MAG: YcgN family cysteine cluster protein [Pseudohongiellaceae bacterium]